MDLERHQADRNLFASICFLDITDNDYVAVRLLYKNGLRMQALILFQQAVEKYLKAALLYNQISQTTDKDRDGRLKSTHSLKKLYNRANSKGGFKLSPLNRMILFKLEGIQDIRYLTLPVGISDDENFTKPG